MVQRIGRIPLRDRVHELNRVYGIIEREIMKELLLIDIGNYQEIKAVKVQEKIEGLIKMLNKSAMEWAKAAIPEAYDKGYEVAKTRLEILGAEKDEEFPRKTHEQSIEFEIGETIDTLIKANLSIKMNVATYLYITSQAAHRITQIQEFDFRDEAFISGLLDDAIIAGETRTYTKNTVLSYLKTEIGEGNFIQIRGRNYNMKKYADTVAKTRLRTVQTEAVLNSCKEYNNDLVEFSAHGCDCIICEPYEAGIYSLSGKSTVHSYLDAHPPLHPRCQHHIRPVSEAALEVREKFREKPYVIEATGPRQAKVASLDDALKGLPRRHVMRVEKYYIDTSGKMAVDVPHFKGQAAGYWRNYDKSVHLSSEWATNRQVIFHEVGHAAYDTGIVPYSSKFQWGAWRQKAISGQIKYPSQYALENTSEFFAECYSHYYLKNYHLIDDGIKKWFDKTFKGGM